MRLAICRKRIWCVQGGVVFPASLGEMDDLTHSSENCMLDLDGGNGGCGWWPFKKRSAECFHLGDPGCLVMASRVFVL